LFNLLCTGTSLNNSTYSLFKI